ARARRSGKSPGPLQKRVEFGALDQRKDIGERVKLHFVQTSRFLIEPRLFAARMQPNAVRASGPVPAAGRAERAAVIAAAGTAGPGGIRTIRGIRTLPLPTPLFSGIFAIHAQ